MEGQGHQTRNGKIKNPEIVPGMYVPEDCCTCVMSTPQEKEAAAGIVQHTGAILSKKINKIEAE